MSKAKVVTSGKLWGNRTPREVLWSVLKIKTVNCGIIRIKSDRGDVDGDIGILKGIYVLGGQLEGGGDGYDAVKKLLCVTDGSFQYIDVGDDLPDNLDQNLKVRLTQLINLMPTLPANVEELQAKSSLNRIRAMDATQLRDPDEIGAVDQNTSRELEAWETEWNKKNRTRAIAVWGTFAVIACMAALLYWFQPH